MDRALLREGETPSAGVSGRRTGDDVSSARAPAAKRPKPRRISRLKLPEKGKGNDNELFHRSNTAPVRSSSLSDRLSERPASARQLSNILHGNKRPAGGDTMLSADGELERRAGGSRGPAGGAGSASLEGMMETRPPLATISVTAAAATSAAAAAAAASASTAATMAASASSAAAVAAAAPKAAATAAAINATTVCSSRGRGGTTAGNNQEPPVNISRSATEPLPHQLQLKPLPLQRAASMNPRQRSNEERPKPRPVPRTGRMTEFFPRVCSLPAVPTQRPPMNRGLTASAGRSGSPLDTDRGRATNSGGSRGGSDGSGWGERGPHEREGEELVGGGGGGGIPRPRTPSLRGGGGGGGGGGGSGGGGGGGRGGGGGGGGGGGPSSLAMPELASGLVEVVGSPAAAAVVAAAATAAARAARAAAAEKAATAAERRAAAAAAAAAAAEGMTVKAEAGSAADASHVEATAQADAAATAAAAAALASSAVAATVQPAETAPATGVADDAMAMVRAAGVTEAEDEIDQVEQEPDVPETATDANVAWPCRRTPGAVALSLTQRQRTGGRVGVSGSNFGDDGKEAFRRRALSAIFGKGLTTMWLRMGRVLGSRTGAGVIRGSPEEPPGPRRVGGGVTSLTFDSMGSLLAAGGAESVTIYDFDEYVPQIPRLKSKFEAGVRAYLQPIYCIQTRRAVSCLRWNPANEGQLAVSFLHYDEIELFDFETILPNSDAKPLLTLTPGGRGGSGGFRAGQDGGMSAASRPSGRSRGLGHLSFEFVLKGSPGNFMTHVVAGGREGTFRVWRFGPRSAGQLTPYLQTQPGTSPGGGASSTLRPPDANVTAVCCISPDVALVGTDKGTLIAYSLRQPKVKAFQSGKTPDKLARWNLASEKVWRCYMPDGDKTSGVGAFRIQSVEPSRDHGPGVVVCGLQSGRVVVFDTRSGRALGITTPGISSTNVGFCGMSPDGVDWGQTVLACSKSADVGEELLLLATSARAALDSRRWGGGGRDSRLRPGPGWALGEAGGGGFRVEQSKGYDLCLPVEVEEAVPGQSRVVLSRDVRGYLCARTQVRLLGTRMVTSSILVGGEEHSVEAMNRDGTSLVLAQTYGGPQVEPRRAHGRVAAGGVVQSPWGALSSSFSEACRYQHYSDTDRSEVDGDSDGDDSVGDGPDIQSRARRLAEASLNSASRSSSSVMGQGLPVADPESADLAHGESLAPDESLTSPPAGGGSAAGGDGGGNELGRLQGETGEDREAGDIDTEDAPVSEVSPDWDRAWRPNGVRIFAKLKAVFGGRGGNAPEPSHDVELDDPFCKGRTHCEGEERSDERGDSSGYGSGDTPSWASYQVVARARLGLPATAVTCHPRMNFVLVGLSDGTIVVVLPGAGRMASRKTTR